MGPVMDEPISHRSRLEENDCHKVIFSVLTLNCWGLKWISKNRSIRFKAICEYLKQGLYDFIFLQEVWIESDYRLFVSQLKDALPYSQFFEAGMVGSGLCVFSKVPIRHFFFIPYQANGYFYKVWHGDWFTGKGVSVCQVIYKGLAMNLLNTHTHVETGGLEYVAHRLTQAVCLVDVVNLCLECADLTILAGDFNADPDGQFFNLVSRLGGLSDAYSTAENQLTHPSLLKPRDGRHHSLDTGETCGLPSNSYTSKSSLNKFPNGRRLDYILYRLPIATSESSRVRVLIYSRPLPCRIPSEFGKAVSYSDHEAVAATFQYEFISQSAQLDPDSDGPESPALSTEVSSDRNSELQLENSNSGRVVQRRKHVPYPKGSFDRIPSSRTQPEHPFHSSSTVQRRVTRAASMTQRDDNVTSQPAFLSDAIQQLEASIHALQKGFKIYVIISICLLIFLLATLYLPCLSIWATVLTNFARSLLSLIFVFIALVQPVHIKREIHTLKTYLNSLRFKSEFSSNALSLPNFN